MTLTLAEMEHLSRCLPRLMRQDQIKLLMEPHLQTCEVCRKDFQSAADKTRALADRLGVEQLIA